MKSLAPLALAATLGLVALPAAVAAEPRPLNTRIDAVTVYADRAQVVRVGSVELPPAGGVVVVAGLPGWIDEESVRVTLDPAKSGRILDVAVERRFLVEASDESVRAADLAVREIEDQLEALADEEQVLTAEIEQLEAVRAFSLEKLPRDMATRDVPVQTFSRTIEYVSATLRKNRATLRELAAKSRALEPEREARSRAREELRARAQLEQRSIAIQVEGQGRATLHVTYLTPGAAWEPLGELRASRQGREVTLTQYASVVQTTGEDWDGARLSFSTQRPTDLLNVPRVQALLLGEDGAGIGELIGRMGESFERAESTYRTQSAISSRDRAALQHNIAQQRTIQDRSRAIFTQLADRGTTTHFSATAKQTVRADGKAVRVPLATTRLQAEHKLVAAPAVSLNAVHTATLVNGGDQPILPGRLALYVDGAFVGHTESSFVAPGETFSTYLGVHERVKLTRGLDRKRSKLERGRRKSELRVAFVITAENLGDQPITLDLGDRVPVAGIDDIEVNGVRIPDKAKRDANGVVTWTATLAPGTATTWQIEYTLEYPSDLLSRAALPDAPAPSRTLYKDIEMLEQML